MRQRGSRLVVGSLLALGIDWVRRLDFVVKTAKSWWGDAPPPQCFLELMDGVLSFAPWALVVVGGGLLIWDRRQRPGTPLTESWVERRLIALGFDADVTRDRAAGCTARLRYGYIDTEEAAERFFADNRTLQDLRGDVYPHDLRRTTGSLDPIGYCLWGPGLHLCPDDETRAKHHAHLKEIIRDMWKHGER